MLVQDARRRWCVGLDSMATCATGGCWQCAKILDARSVPGSAVADEETVPARSEDSPPLCRTLAGLEACLPTDDTSQVTFSTQAHYTPAVTANTTNQFGGTHGRCTADRLPRPRDQTVGVRDIRCLIAMPRPRSCQPLIIVELTNWHGSSHRADAVKSVPQQCWEVRGDP